MAIEPEMLLRFLIERGREWIVSQRRHSHTVGFHFNVGHHFQYACVLQLESASRISR